MGEHRAPRLPLRGLRSSYARLLQTYGRLLRDYRRLEAEYRALRERAPSKPSAGVELYRRQTTWGADREAMDVERARELVRDIGLLTSAGG